MTGRIAALSGRVPELTATQLDGMDATDFAALYSSGVRLLTVKNNDTITLHAVDSDGALAWLDTNMPRENLLVNGDYRIAQAGYGGMHGTQAYAADRWLLVNDATAVKGTPSGILLNGSIRQVIDGYDGIEGTECTIEAVFANNGHYIGTGVIPSNGTGLNYGDAKGGIYISATSKSITVYASVQDTLLHVRLLRGRYAVRTIPPWQKPDPDMEILKCQLRFFVPCNGAQWFPLELTGGGVCMHFPVRMAKAPALVESKYGPMQVYVDGQWKDMKMDGFLVDFAQNSVGIRASAGNVFPDGVSVSRGSYLVRYPPSFVCDL